LIGFKKITPDKEKEIYKKFKNFCKEKLNKEYYILCDTLLLDIITEYWSFDMEQYESSLWSASIIYVVGSINFLFDDSFEPFISRKELSEYFKVDIKLMKENGRFIKNKLDIKYFDDLYTTKYLNERNPFHKYIYYNDVFTPLDEFPEDIIEKVKEIRKNGTEVFLISKKKNPNKIKIEYSFEKPYYVYKNFFSPNDFKSKKLDEVISNLSKSLEEKMNPKNIKEILS